MHTVNYIPSKEPVKILITSGASCPDAVVEKVIRKITSFFGVKRSVDEIAAAIS